ncbi:MAG TPA: hypothetical protein PLR99_22160 [Polyangiaceae bacterium]|nr:hypothetical protein [Polyangiaceae bacterium]
MGVLVRFESRGMLLQREDFPAALRSLKKVARGAPELFRDRAAVMVAADLPAALEASDLAGTLDSHGDLVALSYAGDKLPPGAPDDFPLPLVVPWKKLLRAAAFEQHLEGAACALRATIDRGVVRSQEVPVKVRRFVQLGPVPVVPLGESAEIRLRYVSDVEGDDVAVAVKASDAFEPIAVALASTRMRPGDETTLTVRALADRQLYFDDVIAAPLYGDAERVTVRGHASLRLGVPEDLARAHELEACEHDPGVGVYLGANKSAAALEDARRYCRRFAREPGAAFLDRVAEGRDLPEALRAAGFAPAVDAAGDLRALAFVASRLPGHERFVVGLLRSFAGLTGARGARLRLAFDMTPRWWTTLLFDPGRLRRAHEPRSA